MLGCAFLIRRPVQETGCLRTQSAASNKQLQVDDSLQMAAPAVGASGPWRMGGLGFGLPLSRLYARYFGAAPYSHFPVGFWPAAVAHVCGILVRRPTPIFISYWVLACRYRACTRGTLVRHPTPKLLPCRVLACRCCACKRYFGAAPYSHLHFLLGFGLPLSRLYARCFGAAACS